jgi:uridine kinase
MHHEYLEPTKQFADLIVGEETDVAAEVLAARIVRIFKDGQSVPSESSVSSPGLTRAEGLEAAALMTGQS